jgi:uncharacterized membrane protein YphA (DoxX/SURF4 family)
VQRPFSSFPNGRAGVGLLLLRIVVAAFVISDVVQRVLDTPLHGFDIVGATLSTAAAVTTLIGLFTRASAAILAAAIASGLLPVHGPAQAVSTAPAAFGFANALILGLLGPGAFSVDAQLRGRREIVIARRAAAQNVR